MNREIEAGELEPADVVVRTPSVVLSVRLDEETARALKRIAGDRNLRMSDAVREAVSAYVRTTGSSDFFFSVESRPVSFAIGTASVWTDRSEKPAESTKQPLVWRTEAA